MPNPSTIALEEENNALTLEGSAVPVHGTVTPVLGPVEQKIFDLDQIAQASARFFKAVTAFESAGVPTDEQTEEVAVAEGEMITLLVTHGYLDASDDTIFEQYDLEDIG